MEEELLKRITINPDTMVGKPTIRGMRITVEQILNSLAADISVKDLIEDYPELEINDVKVLYYMLPNWLKKKKSVISVFNGEE
ncbi:MAG: DUF433 domain-containing protein [bacterium]|nr:DUF433 domain-containing protein [bacterium]